MARQQRVYAFEFAVATIVAGVALLIAIVWPPALWLCGVGAVMLAIVASVASIGRRQTILFLFWIPKDDPPLARWQTVLALSAVILLFIPPIVILIKSAVP